MSKPYQAPIHPDYWRIEKIVLHGQDKGKIRWLLQEKRTNSYKPYWLTYRVYRTSSEAQLKLRKLLAGKNIDL